MLIEHRLKLASTLTPERPHLTKSYVNSISHKIIGSAIHVHKELGPGLLESVYKKCLYTVLKRKGLHVVRECPCPLYFEGELLSEYLRIDLLVEDLIIVEVKAVECIIPVHTAQLLTYLKLAEKPKGLLINFNSVTIRSDLKSLVSPLFEALP